MRIFLTIIIDSIRLLRARALFWISLGISVLVALLYLSIGFDEQGMTLLFGAFNLDIPFLTKGSEGAELVYLGMFRNFIVAWWLTWIAIVIALVSCAPIFPEFMNEGSAGVALSKPVSRVKLFAYKYIGALLFIAVQAVLFAVIVLFAIRWRVGSWNPTVFWSVPVVVLVFSYLFAVLVLLGIKTRSVMASVMITLLVWFTCFIAQIGESMTYSAAKHGVGITGVELSPEDQEKWRAAHRWARLPYVLLPKPGETTALLDRWIVLGDGNKLGESTLDAMREGGRIEGLDESVEEDLERHSPAWIIGSSLAFEAAVLALACWMFSRRDF
jgi:ABC-type transport system involved in multi-copper enzyme maturation permease subunit